MKQSLVITAIGEQFPFGFISYENLHKYRQIYVRQKIEYRNSVQKKNLDDRIQIFQKIKHRNIITLQFVRRSSQNKVDLFYSYIQQNIESFACKNMLKIKDIHQQLIKMIVFAAKSSIITSFDPKKMGIKQQQGHAIIKYFLPITQIIISNDRKLIQRSVNIFSVQSMQYLDSLVSSESGLKSSSNLVNKFYLSAQNKFISSGMMNRQKSMEKINKNNMQSKKIVLLKNKFSSNNNLSQRNYFSQKMIEPTIVHNHPTKQPQISYKTIGSTKHTINKSKQRGNSKQHSQHSSYKSSIEKYLVKKEQLNDKMIKIKQRSQKALNTLKQINVKLINSPKSKQRKYTYDIQPIKRFSLDKYSTNKINKL